MVALLEERLADLMDLTLRVEWEKGNLKEPGFIPLRDLFDKVRIDSKEHGNRIAARMAELGAVVPEGLAVASGSRIKKDLPWSPPAHPDAQEQVAVLSSRVSAFRRQVRLSLEAAEEAGDGKTAELFRQVGLGFDRYAWLMDAARPGR